jgi:hypothetical protein
MVKGVSSTSWLSAAVFFSTSVMVDVLFDSATDEIKLFMGKPNG